MKTVIAIPYNEVERVGKNYGRKGFGGRRVDPKRGLIVGIVFVAVLFVGVFVTLANDKS